LEITRRDAIIVKYELTLFDSGHEKSSWLHRGTLVLPDSTPEQKVLKQIRKTIKLPKGCFQVEKTDNGWAIQPKEKIAKGSITVAS
jgi:hypothetical protein